MMPDDRRYIAPGGKFFFTGATARRQPYFRGANREDDLEYIVRRLQRVEKEISGDACEMFAAFIDAGDVGKFAKELPQQLKANFTKTMQTDFIKEVNQALAA